MDNGKVVQEHRQTLQCLLEATWYKKGELCTNDEETRQVLKLLESLAQKCGLENEITQARCQQKIKDAITGTFIANKKQDTPPQQRYFHHVFKRQFERRAYPKSEVVSQDIPKIDKPESPEAQEDVSE